MFLGIGLGIELGPSSWIHSNITYSLGTEKAYDREIMSLLFFRDPHLSVDLGLWDVTPRLLQGGILKGSSLVMGYASVWSLFQRAKSFCFLCDSGYHREERKASLEGCLQAFPWQKYERCQYTWLFYIVSVIVNNKLGPDQSVNWQNMLVNVDLLGIITNLRYRAKW